MTIEEEKKVGPNTKIQKYRNKKNGTQKKFGQDNESVESDSEEEEDGGRRWNPYTEFLENIEDEGSEEEVNLENHHHYHHQQQKAWMTR